MFEFLTIEELLESHQEQIRNYGGTQGIRDLGLLESAVAQPAASFDDRLLHADVFEIAAAYLFHIVQNHPFIDGNKRVGLEAALLFLELNGHSLEAPDEKLLKLVLDVAQGQRLKPEIAEFFRTHAAL